MKHTKTFKTNPDHVDFQGIMDGLYYPFYMEEVRHEFVKKMLGFDLKEEAEKGINMILAEYTMKFKRSLQKNDEFEVDCVAEIIPGTPKLKFEQRITRNGKIVTEGSFIGTCVPATGGRPFLPESIIEKLS